MEFRARIDPTLRTPIYRQLVEAISEWVRGGAVEEGTQLWSVRELALELRINPNTVARAYRELEAEGVVVSQRGKGVFTRSNVARTTLEPELEQAVEALLTAVRASQIALEDVLSEVRRRQQMKSNKESE